MLSVVEASFVMPTSVEASWISPLRYAAVEMTQIQ